MTLDELEKMANESPLIATMATQHLKQLLALCRLQNKALKAYRGTEAGLKLHEDALAAYEEFNK